MTEAERDREPRIGLRIEWGVAHLAAPGEVESGDRHVVRTFPDGALIAALDGLGHGAQAAAAARIATVVLEAHPRESVISLARRCHEALTQARGVTMSLASFNAQDGTMTWLGVGNVEGLLIRGHSGSAPTRESLLLRGGVVGYQLPHLYATVIPVASGDLLVFATDGIRQDFGEHLSTADAPQHVADRILAKCGKGTDDALVLVVSFLGEAP